MPIASFAETDFKIDYFETVNLVYGYNMINLSSQFNYFRGGMFLIDETLGGRIAVNYTKVIDDPTCVSDFFPIYNQTLIKSMKIVFTMPQYCRRFYFKAYGQKYETSETYNFTKSYTALGNFTVSASFNNYVNQNVFTSQPVNVYGE